MSEKRDVTALPLKTWLAGLDVMGGSRTDLADRNGSVPPSSSANHVLHKGVTNSVTSLNNSFDNITEGGQSCSAVTSSSERSARTKLYRAVTAAGYIAASSSAIESPAASDTTSSSTSLIARARSAGFALVRSSGKFGRVAQCLCTRVPKTYEVGRA